MRVVAPAGLIAERYRLLSPLGSGSSATVWAASDETLGRQVALKLLSGAAATDSDEREQLRREARALAALTHPHVIVVYDFLETPGFDGTVQPVLVTELLEGRSLAARLAEGPLPWREALSVCGQLAAALAAAHRAGIVHRDVAPGNVMLTGSGVKLLDFGLAEAITTAREPSDDGTTVGTPVCMAPEQLMGRGALPASDVYALGCVLHWCLTGRPPYRDRDLVWLSQAHLRAEPPPLTVDGLPDSISELYLASLAKEPDERPSAGEAAAVLAPYAPASVLTALATSTLASASVSASASAAAARSVSTSTDRQSSADGPTELLPVFVSAGAGEDVSAATDGAAATSAGTRAGPPPPSPPSGPSRHAGRGRPIDRRRLLPLAVLLALTIIGLMMFGLAQTMDGTGKSATRSSGTATGSATSATSTTPGNAASATATVGSVVLPSGSAVGAPSASLSGSASASMSAPGAGAGSGAASPPISVPPSQAPSMAGVTLPALPDPAADPLGYVQGLGNQVQVLIGLGPATLQPDAGQNLLNALGGLQNLVVTAQQHPGNKQWRDVANAIAGLEQQISNDAAAGQISGPAANVLVGELQSLSAVLPNSSSNGNGNGAANGD